MVGSAGGAAEGLVAAIAGSASVIESAPCQRIKHPRFLNGRGDERVNTVQSPGSSGRRGRTTV